MPDASFNALAQLFLAASDQTRLRLIKLMADEPRTVSDLSQALGLSQPKVSRHLAYLRNSGLVGTERSGKWVRYQLARLDDRSADGVYDAIIDALGDTAAVPNQNDERYSHQPTFDDAYAQTYMNENQRPATNEIDVFLL